ncbi:hypothetical protein BANRA_04328 [Escherichia coli]|nr:hypothetical protein BANRA_04328 [Escherichia coli]
MLLKYLRNLIVSVFCTLFLLRYIPQMGHADILTASGLFQLYPVFYLVLF